MKLVGNRTTIGPEYHKELHAGSLCRYTATLKHLERKSPIYTDYCSVAASIVGGDGLPMTSHQVVSSPPNFKHRFVHGTTTHLLTRRPEDLGINPLQRLVGTQEQSVDIVADMLKSIVSAEYLSVGGEKSLESRDNFY